MQKVLFIEDEPSLQKSLTMALKAKGLEVFSAFDGEAGFNMIREVEPDIILLDLILPKMDGFQILEKLKSQDDTKHIPIIILTNLENTEDVQKVIDLGATNYLVKANYDVHEISDKVKEVLDSSN